MTRIPPEAVRQHGLEAWVEGLASLYVDRNALAGHGLEPELASTLKAAAVSCRVRTSTLPSLLARHPDLSPLDVLQIDTEGADWVVLRQANLASTRVVQLEVLNLPEEERVAVVRKLQGDGFSLGLNPSRTDLLAVSRGLLPDAVEFLEDRGVLGTVREGRAGELVWPESVGALSPADYEKFSKRFVSFD